MVVALARRPKDARRSKYELMHTVRVHLGCEDDAFGCMGNGEDAEGIKASAHQFLIWPTWQSIAAWLLLIRLLIRP